MHEDGINQVKGFQLKNVDSSAWTECAYLGEEVDDIVIRARVRMFCDYAMKQGKSPV